MMQFLAAEKDRKVQELSPQRTQRKIWECGEK
jgi:hypothetical protein